MSTFITNQLDDLLGKNFQYKGKKITIENYKILQNRNIVIFTPQALSFSEFQIKEFIDSLEPESQKNNFVPSKELSPKSDFVMLESSEEIKSIKQTLLDVLDKVKADPVYIPQAKAVCEVVNNFVNIQKNEIDLLNLVNKYK